MESTIAPGYLVATPHMRDPYFERSVVFMMEHDDDEGSLGLIVNRYSNLELTQIFKEFDLGLPEAISKTAPSLALEGGPVAPQLSWIIHTLDWTSNESRIFGNDVAITSSPEILEALAAGKGPADYLFCLGYTGWGPHQLIDEIKTGAWLNVSFTKNLLFDIPLKDRWSEAISTLGINPINIAPVIGDA